MLYAYPSSSQSFLTTHFVSPHLNKSLTPLPSPSASVLNKRQKRALESLREFRTLRGDLVGLAKEVESAEREAVVGLYFGWVERVFSGCVEEVMRGEEVSERCMEVGKAIKG